MADYCTLAEVKGQIKKSGTDMDTVISDVLIPGVSRAIDRFCNRSDEFVALAAATARLYAGDGSTVQWIDENTGVTLVEVKDSPSDTDFDAWAAADWIAATGDPERADFNRTPITFLIVSAVGDFATFTSGSFTGRRGFRRQAMRRGVPTVRVTAKWGYATVVPSSIKEAAIAQVSRWLKRGQSSWADILATTPLGNLRFQTNRLDPDIQFMLIDGRWVKPAVGRRY